jgi:hypothetical protein
MEQQGHMQISLTISFIELETPAVAAAAKQRLLSQCVCK